MNSLPEPRPLAEREPVAADRFTTDIFDHYEPIVLRGQAAHWPAVAAAREGHEAIARYIAGFDTGRPVEVMVGAPTIEGRFFYRDDMRGFNFKREPASVTTLLRELVRLAADPAAPALYAGAAAAGQHLPGWIEANAIGLPLAGTTPRVWIGNATHVSTHFDASPNLACVVAGERRFLLFPPDQIANLYIGPIDVTMAGQPSSMVDPYAPDLDRFPRFAEAMRHARVAVLRPGDAIFMPALWWHNIRAFGPLNVLVNYWWDSDPRASPMGVLAHALLAIRDLPPGERAAWRGWFDHYIFGDAAPAAVDHVPEHARGVLGPANPARDDRLRTFLKNVLPG
ncbi:cupin-like domain-containing protein [Sphingomonas sp. S1-29]|uniref:cupin-like domain-containing protein n=1 Tax=Sphingomonas sp. S1-29 TaxID=2991074 RepID=UPI00223F6A9F|nr:cupin-like domain-containing protein [Sphingomonas sp. S1-29]UZK70674.1 cupin-like domain-containing protein [Sphingomonas sp. S1-29]